MKANWGFLTTLASDLKSETAVLMRERANENKKWLSRCGAAVLKTQSENIEVLGNNLICNSLSNDRSSFFLQNSAKKRLKVWKITIICLSLRHERELHIGAMASSSATVLLYKAAGRVLAALVFSKRKCQD